jgi:hypothetical protein
MGINRPAPSTRHFRTPPRPDVLVKAGNVGFGPAADLLTYGIFASINTNAKRQVSFP